MPVWGVPPKRRRPLRGTRAALEGRNPGSTASYLTTMRTRSAAGPELDAGILVELHVDAFDLGLTAAVAYRGDRVLPPAAEALIKEIGRITSGPKGSGAEGSPPSRG